MGTKSATNVPLTGTETANRMAYLLWDAPPDDALLAAAASGDLATRSGRRQAAERMLNTAEARSTVTQFFKEWLGLGIHEPDVDSALAAAFEEEVRRVIEQAVFDGGSIEALFSSPTTWVNRALASHYELSPAPASDVEWVEMSLPAVRTGGVLALGGVANAHGSLAATSPTRRGRFVRERLLCQDILDPPADAAEMNPVLPEGASVRERIEARINVDGCATCHTLMDGIGIGLEDFDHLGRHRTTYENGHAVDALGEIVDFGDEPTFEGTAELSALLAASDEAASCLVVQWFRFGMGRRETGCQTATAQQQFADSGYNLRELLISLIESDSFVRRQGDE